MRKQIQGLIKKYNSCSEPVKASVWYTICNVLNKGIALFATPIFTRIMSEEQYGSFAVFQSWYSIILIFTSLNIFLGGYTKGLLLYKNDRESFTSACLGLTTTITFIFGIIYIANIGFWTNVFDIPPILMAAMYVELTVMPALEFWAAKERFDFKYKKYVTVSVLMTVFSLGVGAISVSLTSYKLEARVFSDIFAKVIFASVIFASVFIKGKTYYVKKYWNYSIKFNLPLLPHYLSNYVLNQSDRVMISKMIGNDKAGFYSVAYTVSMMMTLIVTAINNSLNPYIYKALDAVENNKAELWEIKNKIKRTTTPLFLLVAMLCVLTMSFAPEIIFVFAGDKYTEAIFVIPPIAASCYFIFVYAMFSTVEYYFQETGKIAIATTVCAGLNLILNYFFINLYGYYAAGYTTLFCYICLALAHYVFYKQVLRKKMPDIDSIYDLKAIILISVLLLLIMIAMGFTYKTVFLRYAFIGCVAIVLLIHRKKVMNLISSFRA